MARSGVSVLEECVFKSQPGPYIMGAVVKNSRRATSQHLVPQDQYSYSKVSQVFPVSYEFVVSLNGWK